jgi:hypothetical protein
MIKRYFKSELVEGILICVLGFVAILAAILLSNSATQPFFYGLTLSLYIISSVQICFGIIKIVKANRLQAKVKQYIASSPMDMIKLESPRIMNQVKYNKIMQIVFISCVIASSLFLFFKTNLAYFEGIASGVLIQSITITTALLYSNKRAGEYLKWIYHFYN